MCVWSHITAVQDYEIHNMNAWLKRWVFNLDLNVTLPALLLFGCSRLLRCALLPIYILFSDLSKILTSADQDSAQTTHFREKEDSLPSHCKQLTFRRQENTAADILTETGKKIPLVESTCCMNCHRLLQRTMFLETKLLAGLPKQVEHTTDRHHGPPQHTAGESWEI